ncbi:hypothetical protein HPB52_018742 [Rhipicephalus sanguineus]|uniref:Uncharacterized protein n=1 Tax=Rhipicephalus sanguineus TaxID=34632 RepID=A0A9D4PFU2_RHISA|nr:hypothetical protein HPB52_018742 [Rhipicephalus sanguineus]
MPRIICEELDSATILHFGVELIRELLTRREFDSAGSRKSASSVSKQTFADVVKQRRGQASIAPISSYAPSTTITTLPDLSSSIAYFDDSPTQNVDPWLARKLKGTTWNSHLVFRNQNPTWETRIAALKEAFSSELTPFEWQERVMKIRQGPGESLQEHAYATPLVIENRPVMLTDAQKIGRILVHAGQEGQVSYIEASGEKEFEEVMQDLLKVLVQLFGEYHRCSSEAGSSYRRSTPPDSGIAVLVSDKWLTHCCWEIQWVFVLKQEMDQVTVRRDTTERLPLEHSLAKLNQLFKDTEVTIIEQGGRIYFTVDGSDKFESRLDSLMGAPSASATSAAATSGGAQSGQHTEGKKGSIYCLHGCRNGVPFMEASGPADLKTTMENLLKVLLQVYAGFYRCSSDVLSNRRDAPQPPPSVAVAVAEDTDWLTHCCWEIQWVSVLKQSITVYTGVENGVPLWMASGPADLKTTMENLLKVLLQVYAGFYRVHPMYCPTGGMRPNHHQA